MKKTELSMNDKLCLNTALNLYRDWLSKQDEVYACKKVSELKQKLGIEPELRTTK